MKPNKELRAEARAALSGKWASPVIATLVYFLLSMLCTGSSNLSPLFTTNQLTIGAVQGTTTLLTVLILLPIAWAYAVLFLKFIRTGEEIQFGELFQGFNDYLRILGTTLLMTLYIILWSFLFVIPGIIKGLSYAMTNYILKDEPELAYNAAIEKSMKLMEGHKMQLFLLDLSFIGWGILCILTCGIGFLWLQPYMNTARAKFYENIKAEQA